MTKDTEIAIGDESSAADAARELNDVHVPLNSPYNETTTGRDVKRQSFVKKVQTLSTDNPPRENPMQFVGALCGLCTAGICGICLLALLNIIPIAFIAIGVIYWDKSENCSAGDIAALLVIGGVVHLLQGLSGSVVKWSEARKRERGENGNNRSAGNICLRLFNSFLSMVAFGWFVATCYITYSLYSHVDYDKASAATEDYCNRFLFLFTFWTITAYFIFLAVVLGTLCCIGCCALCASKL